MECAFVRLRRVAQPGTPKYGTHTLLSNARLPQLDDTLPDRVVSEYPLVVAKAPPLSKLIGLLLFHRILLRLND